MKAYFLLISFFILSASAFAQTKRLDLVSSTSGYAVDDQSRTYHWTVGEIVIDTESEDGYTLTQGFLQQYYQLGNKGEEPRISSCNLFPNPNVGEFFIEFLVTQPIEIELEVVNALGLPATYYNYGLLTPGRQRLAVSIPNAIRGTYFLRFRFDGVYYSKRRKVREGVFKGLDFDFDSSCLKVLVIY